MTAFERKILDFIEEHLYIIALIGITGLSFLIRVSVRKYVSGDAENFLLPWYETIREMGGVRGLETQVGNYNMLYQFLIAVMTYLPIKSLYAYKVLSCIFDYLLAVAAAYFVYELGDKKHRWGAFAAYAAIVLSPVVFLNSAMWAQCDSIYTFFIVMALTALCKEQYIRAFVFYGAAISFKLQAVFFLPFLLFAYFAVKKFTVLYFGIIPAVLCASGIPCLIAGRGVRDIFSVYLEQTDTYHSMSMGYPSFWILLDSVSGEENFEFYKNAAIALTIGLLAGWMISWIAGRVKMTRINMLYMSFILTYTCVLFLPAMHERYGYVYEILGIIVLLTEKKTLVLLSALYGTTLMTYGCCLNGRPVNMGALAVVNVAVYIGYAVVLMRRLSESKENVASRSGFLYNIP